MKESLPTTSNTSHSHSSLLFLPAPDTSLHTEGSGFDTIQYLKTEDLFSSLLKEPVKNQSLFTGHLLPKKSKEEVLPPHSSDVWIFCILITVCITFSWIFGVYRFLINQMFRACFSNRYMGILIKDGSVMKSSVLTAVSCIYFPSISLFAYFIADSFSVKIFPNNSAFLEYLFYLGCILVFIVIKYSVIRFLGNVFRSSEISTIFLTTETNFNLLTGTILLPLLFFLFFSHSYIVYTTEFITIGVVGILYLIKIVRSFSLVLTQSKFSKLYLFYYLCATEIIPLLIIAKLLISIN